MDIRPPRPEERQAFIDMALASWLSAYDGVLPADDVAEAPNMLERAADARFDAFRVAVDEEGALLGFYSLGDDNFLWHLYVDPQHFRKGVGRRLLAAAEEEIKGRGFSSVHLDVVEGNDRAVAFYQATGFAITKIDTEEGEVLMEKQIA